MPENVGGRSVGRGRRLHCYRIVEKVRHGKLFPEQATVRMWIGRDAARTHGRELLQLCNERSVHVEEFLRLVTAQPIFENLQTLFICGWVEYRDLVRAP